MPKRKNKLPERLYYNLDEVAKKLDCTISDLLHFAATGNLELCLRMNENFIGNKMQFLHPKWVWDLVDTNVFDCEIKSDFGTLHFQGEGAGDISDLTLLSFKEHGILALDIYTARKIEEAFPNQNSCLANSFNFPRNYQTDITIRMQNNEKVEESGTIDPDEQSSLFLLLHQPLPFSMGDVIITSREVKQLVHNGKNETDSANQKSDDRLPSKERATLHNLVAVLFEKLMQERNRDALTKISQTQLIEEISGEGLQGLSQSNLDRLIPKALKDMNENIKK